MSETATPPSLFSELILWCGVVLLALGGIFTLIRINSEDTSEQALAVYKNQLRTYAQSYLERARIEQAGDNSLAPTLLYVGKDAKIVHASDVTVDYVSFSGKAKLRYSMLAKTPSGRYFHLSYGARLSALDGCKRTPSDCDILVRPHFMALTEEGAKSMIYHSPQFTPELYRSIFNEEPPAPTQMVPA